MNPWELLNREPTCSPKSFATLAPAVTSKLEAHNLPRSISSSYQSTIVALVPTIRYPL